MDSFILLIIFLVITISLICLFLMKRRKEVENKTSVSTVLLENNKENEKYEIREDVSLMEIKPYHHSMIEEYKPTQSSIRLTDKLKEQVENIIKLTPHTNEIIKKENQIVIKFNNDVMKKIKTGELHLMNKKDSINEFRTMAVDNRGKIRAHGWEEIKEVKKVNPAQLANLAFGAMTIITSQEHLDRINKQLTKIDGKVDFLVRDISQEKRGKIQGNIKYLKSLMPDILQQSYGFESSNYHIVENIINETYRDIQYFINIINDLILEINNVEPQAPYKVETKIDSIKFISKRFNEVLELCYGNIELMNVCMSLKSEILPNTQSYEARIDDIEFYMTDLENLENDFISIFNNKINSLDVKFNIRFKPSEYLKNKKQDLQEEVDILKQKIVQNRNEINKGKKLLTKVDDLTENPIDLKVEYDKHGNILAIHKLERIK